MGQRASSTTAVFFEDVVVPEEVQCKCYSDSFTVSCAEWMMLYRI